MPVNHSAEVLVEPGVGQRHETPAGTDDVVEPGPLAVALDLRLQEQLARARRTGQDDALGDRPGRAGRR